MKASSERITNPPACNPRRELFAQELAAGRSAATAYTLAGYRANYGNACRLKANEKIKARVAEIQEAGATRAQVTIASLVAELDEARETALRLGQASAAVSAIMGKAKITGNMIDRTEVGGPGDFENMSEKELREYISSEVRALGIEPSHVSVTAKNLVRVRSQSK